MKKKLTITKHTQLALESSKPTYFRGYIQSNTILKNTYITNSEGLIVYKFTTSNKKKIELYWFMQNAGEYTLHLVPLDDIQTNVDIAFQSVELKKIQFVSPPQEVISPLLTKTEQQIMQGDVSAEKHFWHTVVTEGTPLIEDYDKNQNILTFLYHGSSSTQNISILGAPYDGQVYLTLLPNSTIWFKSYLVPKSSRFTYRISVNVPQLLEPSWSEQFLASFTTSITDPKNIQPKFGQDDIFGQASTVTLQLAPPDLFTEQRSAPSGDIKELEFCSKQLNNTRKITIYQPNSLYELDRTAPLLFIFDGTDYLTKIPMPIILDNLIAQKTIPPLRAIFVDPSDPAARALELTPNPKFADFLANELKPWICQHLNIHPNAEDTVLCGSSFGGLASLYIAFNYPEHFGKVLSQSGSFWWHPNSALSEEKIMTHWFSDLVNNSPTKPIKVYMNAGLFEAAPKAYEILENNRTLASTLQNSGYTVTYEEFAAGHDYFSWRVTLVHGLNALLNH